MNVGLDRASSSTADHTKYLRESIDAVRGTGGEVHLPFSIITTATVEVPSHVVIRGHGYTLTFLPPQGVMGRVPALRFTAENDSCWNTGLTDLTFRSPDQSTPKTMMEMRDVRNAHFGNLTSCDNAWTGDSNALTIYGREAMRFRDCYLYADQPIAIRLNPDCPMFALDHSSFSGSEFTAAPDQDVITVEPGCTLTNLRFSELGLERGKRKFVWIGAGANASRNITFDQVRCEQGPTNPDYSFIIDANHGGQIQRLAMRQVESDPNQHGIFLAGIMGGHLEQCAYDGKGFYLGFGATQSYRVINVNPDHQPESTVYNPLGCTFYRQLSNGMGTADANPPQESYALT